MTEPWIPVRRLDGDTASVSLIGVFLQAHEIRRIEGDLPTQTFALLRLLLAVMYSHIGPADLTAWKNLWWEWTEGPGRPGGPPGRLVTALTREEDLFDLCHPEHPFLQVAGLRSGSVSRLNRLIADVPVGEQFFSTRAGPGADALSRAEAARWLVHGHAYDTAGIKSGAVDDPLAKGGKGYGSKVGPCGALGGVYLEGDDLAETLLLNLIPLDMYTDVGDDRPAWRTGPHTSAYTVHERRPAGPRELLTWRSRRVRLVHDGDAVTGVVLCNGDQLAPNNLHDLEPHSGWRMSARLSKPDRPVWLPVRLDPARAFWRGFEALLPKDGDEDGVRPPLVLRWADRLVQASVFAPQRLLRVHATGVEYGPKQTVFADVLDDALTVRAKLLMSTGNVPARAAIRDSVEKAEEAVTALGHLAANLSLAAGAEDQAPARRDEARSHAFADLEPAFRTWLRDLPFGEPEAEAAGHVWERTVQRVLRAHAAELIADAGEAAWSGRAGMDVAIAERRFHRALRKALPLTHPEAVNAD
ncbi:type I-E CRISPR-associated protein Cse1/CasA [Actinorhabdospora filicis]|uniref:type I-E CRISPR-associated protein Cse1/CasA n=1 Tax=Actinorhabdospora filicis TaxID=1785913 RepID=UPI0025523258|nr:type I-E CRISPR-associated protein Cse1/CasA [Actinorhabdospora filicis]